MESEPMLTPRDEIPSTAKNLLRGGSNTQCCIKQDSQPNTQPMSYSGPLYQEWSEHCECSCLWMAGCPSELHAKSECFCFWPSTGLGVSDMTGLGVSDMTGLGVSDMTGLGVSDMTGLGVSDMTGPGVSDTILHQDLSSSANIQWIGCQLGLGTGTDNCTSIFIGISPQNRYFALVPPALLSMHAPNKKKQKQKKKKKKKKGEAWSALWMRRWWLGTHRPGWLMLIQKEILISYQPSFHLDFNRLIWIDSCMN